MEYLLFDSKARQCIWYDLDLINDLAAFFSRVNTSFPKTTRMPAILLVFMGLGTGITIILLLVNEYHYDYHTSANIN